MACCWVRMRWRRCAGRSLQGELGRRASSRVWPLVGLAAALALTLNVHFYGVLLLVPLCGAELVRTLVRRRLDGGMLAAIGVGMASLVATIPYIKASGEFKKHYYVAAISAHMLTQPYRQMMLDYTEYPKAVQTLLMLVILLAGAVVVWGCARAVRRRVVVVPVAEWVMVRAACADSRVCVCAGAAGDACAGGAALDRGHCGYQRIDCDCNDTGAAKEERVLWSDGGDAGGHCGGEWCSNTGSP